MMPEQQPEKQPEEQATFAGWAIVEVMGHRRYAGYVTTQAFGQAVLFRIDIPEMAAREEVLKRPAYVEDQYVEPGATVRHETVQGYTKLIGAASIYAMTPCTQEAAIRALASIQQQPMMLVKLPAEKALAAAAQPELDVEMEDLDTDDPAENGGDEDLADRCGRGE